MAEYSTKLKKSRRYFPDYTNVSKPCDQRQKFVPMSICEFTIRFYYLFIMIWDVIDFLDF